MENNTEQTCVKCGEHKSFSEYHRAALNHTGYSRRCKSCALDYQREYRKNNRKLISERTNSRRREFKELGIEILGGKCSLCNQCFPLECYDFHHKDPSKKDFTIAERMSIRKETFIKEVEKCILVCANCHRIIHAKEKV